MTTASKKPVPTQIPLDVRSAVARMQSAPRFFSEEEWNVLASYDGPVVSGDPEGRVPENLEEDDNE